MIGVRITAYATRGNERRKAYQSIVITDELIDGDPEIAKQALVDQIVRMAQRDGFTVDLTEAAVAQSA